MGDVIWPPVLTKADEKKRAAAGLTIKKDGWHKSIAGKTRYVCKRLPLADALAILPARVAAVRGGYEDNQLTKRWGAKVGLPYTGLRTTFATLVDDWHDQRAIDMVMGHSAGKMGKHIRVKHYARQFSPARVRALVSHAYALAFGSAAPLGAASPQTPAADPASQTPEPATPAKSEGRPG